MTKLEHLISVLTTNHVYIQTHNFPDPDAVASAFGLQRLLAAKNVKSTICYDGKIDRPNIKNMIKLFNIEIIYVGDAYELTEDDEIILVDSQKGNGNISDITGNEIACIDHHPTTTNQEYLFFDIRDDIGSCSSIIASYFEENDIEMDEDVAEALLYGIKMDTADMVRGVSKLDLDMFYKLFLVTDRKKIASLDSAVLQLSDLKAFASAMGSIYIEENVAFADTGNNCPEALIATIADFMLEIEDVEMAVVYSEKRTGIKLSVRCTKNSGINAGIAVMKSVEGIGTGGGHSSMAGGFIPTKEDMDVEDKVILLDKIRSRIMENTVEHSRQ